MRISDWSSDVCSSDLLRLSPGLSGGAILSRSEGLPDLRGDREYPAHDHRAQDSRLSAALPGDIAGPTIEQPSVWYFRYRRAAHALSVRSEERRVGKECVSTCRSRWAPYHYKKKKKHTKKQEHQC